MSAVVPSLKALIDATAQLRTDTDAAAALIAANVLQKSFEQQSGTLALNTTFTFAHNFGEKAKILMVSLVCGVGERGWQIGDEVPVTFGMENFDSNSGLSLFSRPNVVGVRTGNNNLGNVIGADGSSRAALTPGRWHLKVRAWA